MIGDAVVVCIHGRAVRAELVEIRDAVAVDVRVARVGDAVAVGVHVDLVAVGDAVAVAVQVEEVGHPVSVRVDRRRRAVGIARLDRVGDRVAVGVVIARVGDAVAVEVALALVFGGDEVAIRIVPTAAAAHSGVFVPGVDHPRIIVSTGDHSERQGRE